MPRGQHDGLEEAQSRLLGLWNEKQLVTHRLLANNTTNFYTYIASNNEPNTLAQRDTTSKAEIIYARWD